MMCQSRPCHLTFFPIGSFNPICRMADSLKIKADESVAMPAENSRPSTIFHSTTSPYAGSINIVPNSTCMLGSFPSHSRLLADDETLVVVLEERDILSTLLELSNSFLNVL